MQFHLDQDLADDEVASFSGHGVDVCRERRITQVVENEEDDTGYGRIARQQSRHQTGTYQDQSPRVQEVHRRQSRRIRNDPMEQSGFP